jgi:hypothetical protein
MGPVLHVCPDRETAEWLTNASAADSSRILAEHPCQPVVAVATSITPADMNWPSWEVLSWRFVPDPPTIGGVVTVFVRKGGEQQTFDTRFTVLDRASSWR